MKLLAIGDIHLGRIPLRLPEELAGRAHELGPAEAWRRAVDAAIAAVPKPPCRSGPAPHQGHGQHRRWLVAHPAREATDAGVPTSCQVFCNFPQ